MFKNLVHTILHVMWYELYANDFSYGASLGMLISIKCNCKV